MTKKNKKFIKSFLIILAIVLSIILFLFQNNSNYLKLKELKLQIVEHPENLPTKDFAKSTSFWFENSKADILWLEAIQYIWWNAVSSAYKKYLFVMVDLITDLNPYFEKPYKIWMLLLPDYNPNYEDITEEQNQNYINQAITIWLKWIENFCDNNKVKIILEQEDLEKVWTEEKYKDPCLSYEIPYFLAYIYYFHLQDPSTSADYYKIASANTNSIDNLIMSFRY